jgi:hypothetical protein
MSNILERWAKELGVGIDEAADVILKRRPEVAAMPWQEQEILLQSMERLHESRNVPVSLENSEELYRHYFADEKPKQPETRFPKGPEAEREFERTATAEQLKAYFLAKG